MPERPQGSRASPNTSSKLEHRRRRRGRIKYARETVAYVQGPITGNSR